MKFNVIVLLGILGSLFCPAGLTEASGGAAQRIFRQRQFTPSYGVDCGVQQVIQQVPTYQQQQVIQQAVPIYNQQQLIQQVPVYQQQVVQQAVPIYNQAVPIYSYGVGQSFLPSRAFFPRRSFLPGRSFAPGFLGGLSGGGGINLNFGDNSQNSNFGRVGRGRLFP